MSSKKKSNSAKEDNQLQRSIIKRPFTKRKQWPEQAMMDAMKAVEDGSTISRAAREYGAKASLYNRIIGKVTHGNKPG